jgi:hypothetical protein
VSAIERLIDLLAAKYRWGLHPIKMFAALLAPALIVWLADWRLRVLAKPIEEEEARIRRLPRIRRR